jgi:hypothetical protein
MILNINDGDDNIKLEILLEDKNFLSSYFTDLV